MHSTYSTIKRASHRLHIHHHKNLIFMASATDILKCTHSFNAPYLAASFATTAIVACFHAFVHIVAPADMGCAAQLLPGSHLLQGELHRHERHAQGTLYRTLLGVHAEVDNLQHVRDGVLK
jgi:hypothetical protein